MSALYHVREYEGDTPLSIIHLADSDRQTRCGKVIPVWYLYPDAGFPRPSPTCKVCIETLPENERPFEWEQCQLSKEEGATVYRSKEGPEAEVRRWAAQRYRWAVKVGKMRGSSFCKTLERAFHEAEAFRAFAVALSSTK